MNDPLHIFGFCIGHLVVLLVVVGLVLPRWFDVFLPQARVPQGDLAYAPAVLAEQEDAQIDISLEQGAGRSSEEMKPDYSKNVIEGSNNFDAVRVRGVDS